MIAENSEFSLAVPEHGVTDGHLTFTLVRDTPETAALAGICATVLSGILFEKLRAQGTNLVFSFGETATLDIVARSQDDGLNISWDPRESDPAKFDAVKSRLAEHFARKEQAPKETAPPVETSSEISDEEEEYLVKQITRIP